MRVRKYRLFLSLCVGQEKGVFEMAVVPEVLILCVHTETIINKAGSDHITLCWLLTPFKLKVEIIGPSHPYLSFCYYYKLQILFGRKGYVSKNH